MHRGSRPKHSAEAVHGTGSTYIIVNPHFSPVLFSFRGIDAVKGLQTLWRGLQGESVNKYETKSYIFFVGFKSRLHIHFLTH
jgi:hypothetical protein